MPETILIVDGESSQLQMVGNVIQQTLKYHSVTASNGEEAIHRAFSSQYPQPDLILLNMVMPGVDVLQIIREIKAKKPQLPIIVMTPYGDEKRAIQAIQAGANDFLDKPVSLARLKLSLQNTLKIQRMINTIARVQRKMSSAVSFSDIIGQSPLLQNAVAAARQSAALNTPVCIQGEHGTGRELFARAIHSNSVRADQPFVVIDCERIDKQGDAAAFLSQKLQEAHKGTLYLREISALGADAQNRLGALLDTPSMNDSRVICSISKNLNELNSDGTVNPALNRYFCNHILALPNLHDRKQDIPLLAVIFSASIPLRKINTYRA